ncbi:glutaminase [Polaribacter reichenbachii]|uniref:Glutaminase n=1 Tax=Polaribacter reichenbachii TaxID=996801 RepID=A0A1B8TRR9_9FLAO|nr:glutaminase [Polaribacter reichenbachii]APZ44943.1 glutaminase [Polaribacter reichenbachii]AUC18806.1 glutaminase [Polaribacter reichenbachii]OBY62363.1 glutaminase A [Polaribacter reichenbachii]
MDNYKKIIEEIYLDVKNVDDIGKVANYIPELAHIDENNFGVHLTSINKLSFGFGDCNKKFSIQSVSKILSLTLAYKFEGAKLWDRVDVEPSGNPFNSLLQLEADFGKPRNPFINAGAIVICDVLVSHLKNPKKDFLEFCREISDNKNINYNEKVAESEKISGFRNVALCNFIKSFGNIKNDVDDVLDFYFHICSIEMTCKELSEIFLFLADEQYINKKGESILTESQAKRINAIMLTCGFYDESGEFAFRVGLPGKSGVGGGIVAIHPDEYCITVWSPKLNKKGNSYKGMLFLEKFTTKTVSSIF